MQKWAIPPGTPLRISVKRNGPINITAKSVEVLHSPSSSYTSTDTPTKVLPGLRRYDMNNNNIYAQASCCCYENSYRLTMFLFVYIIHLLFPLLSGRIDQSKSTYLCVKCLSVLACYVFYVYFMCSNDFKYEF
jgi:hypothetical protein